MCLSEPICWALLVEPTPEPRCAALPLPLSAWGVGGPSLGGVTMSLLYFAQDRGMNIKILKLTCFLCILLSWQENPATNPCTGSLTALNWTLAVRGLYILIGTAFAIIFSATPKTFTAELQTSYRNMKCFDFFTRETLIQSQVMSITDYGNIVYRNSREKVLQKLESLYNHVMRFTGVDKMGRVKITRLAISKRQVKSAGYHCFIILQMEKPWSNWITHLQKKTLWTAIT